jgi:hypothetical protein
MIDILSWFGGILVGATGLLCCAALGYFIIAYLPKKPWIRFLVIVFTAIFASLFLWKAWTEMGMIR